MFKIKYKFLNTSLFKQMMCVDFVTGEQKAFTFSDQLILIAKRRERTVKKKKIKSLKETYNTKRVRQKR